jgi:Mg2+ and Co2+ transporter CorA
MTDEPTGSTIQPSVPISDVAQTLLDSNATAFHPDVEAMMAQMQALQNRIAAMEAEKGIPSDPIAAAVENLKAHVQAKVNGSPLADLGELHKVVVGLVEHPSNETVGVVRELVSRAIRRYRHLDLAYVEELASDLTMAIVKSPAL